MTGGQMAPTTLRDQKTATTPTGRDRLTGEPLKVAETIAQLDGPIYVARVALYDNKQRTRAKKAIRKALQLQVENRGFTLVEVLAECPTHWKLTPVESEQWVKEQMVPIFPLGVKKDEEVEPWFELDKPVFEPAKVVEVIGGSTEPTQTFAESFPAHIDDNDIAMKFAGAGGDGAQTVAMLTSKTAVNEGFDSTHIPSYGPESRGGTSYADVHIARDEVLSPASPSPKVLVAFNAPSLEKFGPAVEPGGTIIYDSSVISSAPDFDPGITAVGIPCSEIAMDLGAIKVKNVVALGALQAATQVFPKESFLAAIRQALSHNCAMIELNEEAFSWGIRAFEEVSGSN
jgi:2-oxoisovalerate ferredoxin oxidoreductase beta subunit